MMTGIIPLVPLISSLLVSASLCCKQISLFKRTEGPSVYQEQQAPARFSRSLYMCSRWCAETGMFMCQAFYWEIDYCIQVGPNNNGVVLATSVYMVPKTRVIPVPLFSFPMDEIVGGSLSGTVLGALNGDVQLVGGRRSKALYTNGVDQWVDLGNQRDNCMGDLEKCNTGFVMAMWLKLHRYEEAETGIGINEYYITNGGHTRRSKGVALIRIEKKFVVNFRTPSWLWTLTTNSEIVLHTWYHVVLAWYATDGGKIYLNGIIDGEDPHGASVTSNRDGDTYTKFILGCENVAPPKLAGKMTLDELRIWDSRVNEQNVWFMYAADTQYITVVNYS